MVVVLLLLLLLLFFFVDGGGGSELVPRGNRSRGKIRGGVRELQQLEDAAFFQFLSKMIQLNLAGTRSPNAPQHRCLFPSLLISSCATHTHTLHTHTHTPINFCSANNKKTSFTCLPKQLDFLSTFLLFSRKCFEAAFSSAESVSKNRRTQPCRIVERIARSGGGGGRRGGGGEEEEENVATAR